MRYNGENYILTFEETQLDPSDENYVALSEITTNSRLSSLTKAPKVEIRNNVIRNKRNRGILIQSRDVVVENNLFSNIVHGAIMLAADDVQFHESLTPQNVIIRNNKFLRNGACTQYGDIDAFVWTSAGTAPLGAVSGIEISNNFFGESYNAALSLRRVADFNIEGNTFYRPGNQKHGRRIEYSAVCGKFRRHQRREKPLCERFRPRFQVDHGQRPAVFDGAHVDGQRGNGIG